MTDARFEVFRSLVGFSTPMSRLREQVDAVQGAQLRVLLEGESGTGHETVARTLHVRSLCGQQGGAALPACSFVPFGCAAVAAELQASELFGHAAGAFAGALAARGGRLLLATGGTLFLDDVEALAPTTQRMLARALTSGSFTPVGADRPVELPPLNIIAASTRDLAGAAARGEFDAQLFEHLNAVSIRLPALRERLSDLPLLLAEMNHRADMEGRGSVRFTSAAVAALGAYEWPGNSAELARMFGACLRSHAGTVVDRDDLPGDIRNIAAHAREAEIGPGAAPPPPGQPESMAHGPGREAAQILPVPDCSAPTVDMRKSVSDLETALIRWAMEGAGGVVTGAAKRLCINRTTLVEKMRKYGISRAAHGA